MSVPDTSFINYKEMFSNCMDLLYAAVKPYHLVTLNKYLDKAEPARPPPPLSIGKR